MVSATQEKYEAAGAAVSIGLVTGAVTGDFLSGLVMFGSAMAGWGLSQLQRARAQRMEE